MFVPITYKCNQKCVFCSAPQNGPAIPLERVLRALPGAGGIVQLSGGEPLLLGAKTILGILGICARKKLVPELQTNGLLLARLDEKYFSALAGKIASCGGYFNVNFPADTAPLDQRMTGVRGGFAARKAGVERLLKAGARVRLTHVVSRLNCRRLPSFVSFVLRHFGVRPWIQFSYAKGSGLSRHNRAVVAPYELAAPYIRKAVEKAREAGLRAETDHIPPCYLKGLEEICVDVGKMVSGEKGVYLREKMKMPSCRGCSAFARCPGPRKDYIEIYPVFRPEKYD